MTAVDLEWMMVVVMIWMETVVEGAMEGGHRLSAKLAA
jgi:hypothetical protein